MEDDVIAARPTVVLRPARGFARVDLRELWRFRELFLTLALRDIRLRYKQTVLGIAWVVLQPLIATAILAFVFSRVAGLQAPGGAPYVLFVFTAMIAWNAFSGTLTRTSRSLLADAQLVSKVYFPRLILPLSTVGSVALDFAVSLGVLGVLMLAFGWAPPLTALWTPVFLLLSIMLALGIGLCAGGLAVRYRDVNHIVPLLTQSLLYASPVAYWSGQVPEAYRELYALNPLVGLLDGFRWAVLGVGGIDRGAIVYAAAVSVIVFVVGTLAFQRMERRFADVI